MVPSVAIQGDEVVILVEVLVDVHVAAVAATVVRKFTLRTAGARGCLAVAGLAL